MRVTLFDGGSILADLDSLGNRQAEYVYDGGTDSPYAMLTGDTSVTTVRYFAHDDFGNVVGQFVDATHPTQTVTYGDCGRPTVSGETANRLTWKGLSYDPDVGLTYVRARWYDPNIGRFVSEDPLGLQGGINPYVFANNDPINGSDPSGQSAQISCGEIAHASFVDSKPDGGYYYETVSTISGGGSDGGNGPMVPPIVISGGGGGSGPGTKPIPPANPCRTGGGTPFQQNHKARDYQLSAYGIPIPAPADGVATTGRSNGFYVPTPNGVDYSHPAPVGSADFVDFRTNDNYLIRYVHVHPIVMFNTPVQAGQTIGLSDKTGRITGPHTHVQVTTPLGTRIDPNVYFGGCH